MKSRKLSLLFALLACTILSCSKSGEDEGEDCEDLNSTKVTYTNTGTLPLRVVVSQTLTPQFEPVDPIHSIDLAPGASAVREFRADGYFNTWYSNCASTCNRVSYRRIDYESCNDYEEKMGL